MYFFITIASLQSEFTSRNSDFFTTASLQSEFTSRNSDFLQLLVYILQFRLFYNC